MTESSGRVLVVDDDTRVATILRELLTAWHYDVSTARSADEAAAVGTHFQPDVVLLDLHLPGFSGLQGLEYFRSHHPGVPVILITGDLDEPARQVRERGAFEMLAKPFGIPALERVVMAAMQQRRS
jgi:DNA-binding NtrC family response regulator